MAEPFDSTEDPGWPRGPSVLIFMVPGVGQRRARRAGSDGLFVLRQLIVSFSAALILVGVMVSFLKLEGGSALPWLGVLVLLAVASMVAARAIDRPLVCTSAATLAGTYRTRFFVRVAFAEAVALFGFVFTFQSETRWIYYVGAAFALVRFWTGIAPTRSSLARDQQTLNGRGCELSLVASLRAASPPDGGRNAPPPE